ncbi:MAG: BamA/TamA family outer membrane protein [Chitinispirillaceae bacterium]|nr:BamA/TamA family outer membrane protein [Chitinispirillaceae bacterium]
MNALLFSTFPAICSVCLLFFHSSPAQDSPSALPAAQGKRIAHIFVNGNHVTKTEVIRLFLKLDTGMTYDHLQIREAKKRLMQTNLFAKVDLLPVVKTYGCDLHVVVCERGYLHIPLPGIYQYPYKYGKNNRWYCADAGVDIDNFGGQMERLRVSIRAWEWRTLGISWTKPLLPSRHFFGLGIHGDQRPDEFFSFDRSDLSGRLTLGTGLLAHSKISLNLMPMFRRAVLNESGEKIPLDYYQAYGSINWSTDRREKPFDPSRGWILGLDTRTNYLYYDDNTPYVQQTTGFNLYLPGYFENAKFACRMAAVVRNRDAGYLNRLGIGGEGSVRGYARNIIGIGLSEIPNNCIIMSAEYRFTLFTFFPIPVPFSSIVAPFIGNHKTVSPRIDGAVIVDYGRIAPGITALLQTDRGYYQSGAGIGFGLRFIEPLLQLCGCMDVVFSDRVATGDFDLNPVPGVHLYTNLPF